MKKKKILIDCDPGIDDALMLILGAAQKSLEILGITTVGGNVTLDQTVKNARDLMALVGQQEVPVLPGLAHKKENEGTTGEQVHGKNGLGNIHLTPSPVSALKKDAFLFMKESIENNKGLTIIATGPLTNIAHLLQLYPHLESMIKEIHVMGGSTGKGNATPYAEFNFLADPIAAKNVFDHKIPIYMYGLNVTNNMVILPQEIETLNKKDQTVSQACYQMLQFYLNFYLSVGHHGVALHDPYTLAGFIDPSLCTFKKASLDICCDKGQYYGQSKVRFLNDNEEGHIWVATDGNLRGFKELLFSSIDSYSSF